MFESSHPITPTDALKVIRGQKSVPHRDAITAASPLFLAWLAGFASDEFTCVADALDTFKHDECERCDHTGWVFHPSVMVTADDGSRVHQDYECLYDKPYGDDSAHDGRE